MLTSAFTSAYTWVRQHLLISLGIVLLLALIIWGARPVVFAATHTNLRNCGTLYSHFGPHPEPSGHTISTAQVIQCFVQAHQQCRAASLSYTAHGVDTGVRDTYYTANSLGGCGLSGESTSYGMVLRNRTTDFSCNNIIQQADGLHLLSCRQYGDLVVPVWAARA